MVSTRYAIVIAVWLVFGLVTLLLCIRAGSNPYLVAFIAWFGGILTMINFYEYKNFRALQPTKEN